MSIVSSQKTREIERRRALLVVCVDSTPALKRAAEEIIGSWLARWFVSASQPRKERIPPAKVNGETALFDGSCTPFASVARKSSRYRAITLSLTNRKSSELGRDHILMNRLTKDLGCAWFFVDLLARGRREVIHCDDNSFNLSGLTLQPLRPKRHKTDGRYDVWGCLQKTFLETQTNFTYHFLYFFTERYLRL